MDKPTQARADELEQRDAAVVQAYHDGVDIVRLATLFGLPMTRVISLLKSHGALKIERTVAPRASPVSAKHKGNNGGGPGLFIWNDLMQISENDTSHGS